MMRGVGPADRGMPGGAEVARAARARRALPLAPVGTGRSIVVLSWTGTALFGVTAVLATVVFRSPFQQLAFIMAMTLAGLGCVVFVIALLAGAGRSRTHELGIGGWFFLVGSAPRWAQLHLNGSVAAQVLIGLVTASVRPFTTLAFGLLVPVLGLACTGLWGARHGAFGPRVLPPDPSGPARRPSGDGRR